MTTQKQLARETSADVRGLIRDGSRSQNKAGSAVVMAVVGLSFAGILSGQQARVQPAIYRNAENQTGSTVMYTKVVDYDALRAGSYLLAVSTAEHCYLAGFSIHENGSETIFAKADSPYSQIGNRPEREKYSCGYSTGYTSTPIDNRSANSATASEKETALDSGTVSTSITIRDGKIMLYVMKGSDSVTLEVEDNAKSFNVPPFPNIHISHGAYQQANYFKQQERIVDKESRKWMFRKSGN
jgi:hypothetical protein